MADWARHHNSILYFSNHLRGPKGSAGARSWHQTRILSQNFEVTVVIPGIDPVSSAVVTPETYEGLDQAVTVIPVKTTKNDRSSKISRALFYLSAMCTQLFAGLSSKKCDVVLSMSLPVTQLLVAMVIAGIRRLPLVVDVRDLPFETAGEIGYVRARFFIQILKSIENFALRRAALIITNSPRYKPYLVRKGVAAGKIHIAPIGYDDFPPPSEAEVGAWRQKILDLFQQPPAFVATYAGTIGYAVPVEDLLRAAKKLYDNRSIGFVIVGDGQRLADLQRYVTEHDLNVVFTGRVMKADVHSICRASDVCLYPAQQGEFSAAMLGNKVFDYLGAEKPIVYCGPDSAVADVIKELDAGIICPAGDFQALADSIERLSLNPDLVRQYSHAASGFRDAGYTAEASALKLRDLIHSLLSP